MLRVLGSKSGTESGNYGARTRARGRSAVGLAVLAVASLAAATLAGCGGAGGEPTTSAGGKGVSLTAEEQAYLKEHSPLQVGAFNDYPPFGFLDDAGKAAGIGVDYWNMVGEQLGVAVEFSPVSFTEQIAGLKTGDYDSLHGIFPRPEREEWFAFSDPYLVIYTHIYADATQVDATTLEELKAQDLVVAVVKDDTSELIANEAGLKTLAVAGYEEAVDALASGDAQALILDELVAEYFLAAKDLGAKFGAVGEPVDEGTMTMPVQKENTILLGILNKAAAALAGQGDALKAKWLEGTK